MRAATQVPGWLVVLTLPIWFAIAATLGLSEHHYIVAQIVDMTAFAAAHLQDGSNLPPGGGMLAGLGLAAADIVLVGLVFNALLSVLDRFRHGESAFPWLHSAALAAAVVLCFFCAFPLGIGIAWMVSLGLMLWLLAGGE